MYFTVFNLRLNLFLYSKMAYIWKHMHCLYSLNSLKLFTEALKEFKEAWHKNTQHKLIESRPWKMDIMYYCTEEDQQNINNRKKALWCVLYALVLVSFLCIQIKPILWNMLKFAFSPI